MTSFKPKEDWPNLREWITLSARLVCRNEESMMRKLASFATLLILAMLMVGLAAAQPANLLRNPGFEQPYLDGIDGQVAEGWASWYVGEASERPEYMVAPTDRAISGEAQAYSSFLAAHEAGLYQSVSGLTAGVPLTFTANVWVWSTRNDLDPAVSQDPGSVTIEVGIDTTGAIDPEGASIIWSEPVEVYDEFTPVSVTAAPSGDLATVFIKTTVGEARLVTDVYVEDASLVAVDSTAAPTEDAPATVEATVPTAETAPTVEIVVTEEIAAPTEASALPTEDAPAEGTESPFLSTITHTVQSGDSYDLIARIYGSTVAAIKEANNVGPDDDIIYPGDVLIVPVPVPAVVETVDPASVTEIAPEPTALPTEEPAAEPTTEPTVEPTSAPTEDTASGEPTEAVEVPRTYTVRRGDTLMEIANRFDVNVIELGRLNNILNYNLIYVGQVLDLPVEEEAAAEATPAPTNTPAPVRHFVQFGDSIYRIAARYGVTAQAIIEANGIENPNRIYYGQLLIIPQ
jgi:LysM repeat protein